MKRTEKLLLVLLLLPLSLYAQKEQKEINTIKKSLNFLYATGTSTISAEDASNNARELLALEVEQWLKENAKGDYAGYIVKAKENLSEIKTQRGNLMRIFAYVRKTDVLPYYKDENVLMVDVKNDIISQPTDTVKTQPKTEPKSNNVQEQEIAQITQSAMPKATEPTYELSANEKEMLEVKTLSDINKYISQGRDSGMVTAYGKYNADTKLFGKSYLFIFNTQGEVLAVHCQSGSGQINVRTGQKDSITNYGKCGVVWFQLKEE